MPNVKALNEALTIVQPTSADRSPTTGQPVPVPELLTATANPLVWLLTYDPINPAGVRISTATLVADEPTTLIPMANHAVNFSITGKQVTFVEAFGDNQAPYAEYFRR